MNKLESSQFDGPLEEQIIRRAKQTFERLPVLEQIFDRYAASLATALRTYLDATIEVALESFEYMCVEKALDDQKDPAFIALVAPGQWDGAMTLSLDPKLLFAVLEITLGGRQSEEQTWVPRKFTSIEKRIGTKLLEAALDDLSSGFAQICQVEFPITSIESDPQSLALAEPASACVKIKLGIRIEKQSGSITFVIPYSSFESVRPVFAHGALSGQFGGKTDWRSTLSGAIEDASVVVDAVLAELSVPLNDVLTWAPGTVIDLNMDMQDEISVFCAGKPMMRAAMGRRKNASVALRVSEILTDSEEINDVISN